MKMKFDPSSWFENKQFNAAISVLIAVAGWLLVSLYVNTEDTAYIRNVPVDMDYSASVYQALDLSILDEVMTEANLSALRAAQEEDVVVIANCEGYYGDLNTALRSCNDELCLGDITAEEYCQIMEEAAEAIRNDPEAIIMTVK